MTATHSKTEKKIGEMILVRRREMGWTQQVLAERSGMSTIMVHYLETGQRGASAKSLTKLERTLELPDGELLEAWFRMIRNSVMHNCAE